MSKLEYEKDGVYLEEMENLSCCNAKIVSSKSRICFYHFAGKALYSGVLTHAFVLDERGLKMSKSLGNVVDPRIVIEGGKNKKESQ
jgi:hypothetical protein